MKVAEILKRSMAGLGRTRIQALKASNLDSFNLSVSLRQLCARHLDLSSRTVARPRDVILPQGPGEGWVRQSLLLTLRWRGPETTNLNMWWT